jgi:hypothetical protein
MGDVVGVDRHHNGPPDAERIELAALPVPKGRGRPSLYTPETMMGRAGHPSRKGRLYWLLSPVMAEDWKPKSNVLRISDVSMPQD